jgi:hypothetical protein
MCCSELAVEIDKEVNRLLASLQEKEDDAKSENEKSLKARIMWSK